MEQQPTQEALIQQRLNGLLPKIDIAGHPFIIDLRLHELRPENDFSSRINLRLLDMNEDGNKYLFLYHTGIRQVVDINPHTITEVPKDVVLVEIPYELRLDPIGVAREYGMDDRAMLKYFPIEKDLKATVIPLDQTAIPGLVKTNRQKLKNKKPAHRIKRKKGKGL